MPARGTSAPLRTHTPRPVLPRRVSWSLAAASTVWVGGLLVMAWPDRWWVGLAWAAWFGAATWVETRRPWPGTTLTAAGIIGLGLQGVAAENAAPLGPLMIALVLIGYLLPPRWSVWAVPVLLAATVVATEWDTPSILFGSILLLMPWWFGVLVRTRDARRASAEVAARRLALVDPAERARQAAAAAREGVATAAFTVIGDAVEAMATTAAHARESLDPERIETVHRTGGAATQRLRALLVVLRTDPIAADSMTAVTDPPAPEHRPLWVDLLIGSWPAALMLLDTFLTPVLMTPLGEPGPPPPTVPSLLFVMLPLTVAVALRNLFTTPALWVAASVFLLGTLAGVSDLSRDGLSVAIAALALSWSAGRQATRGASIAWLALAATLIVILAITAPDNLPINLAMIVLPFGAGAAWEGHHAAAAAYLDEAEGRRAALDAAERAAVSEERLALARDLHDAASHAVGTMLMQANAARVLRERDPYAARSALDAITSIGREATAELHTITGTPSTASDPIDLDSAIAPLADAARRAGSRATVRLDIRTALGAPDSRLLLRVVREGVANAVRHASGSDVVIDVEAAEGRARASIANSRAGATERRNATPDPSVGSGLGIRGLRELVNERGGDLSAGPEGGQYVLRVSFPLRAPAATVMP